MSKRIPSPFSLPSVRWCTARSPLLAVGCDDKIHGHQTALAALGAAWWHGLLGYALVADSGHDAGIVYMGMAAIAVGNGLFKLTRLPAVYLLREGRSASRQRIYDVLYVRQHRLLLLYAATPWLAARYGWSTAFALSVVGVNAVVNFAFCQRWVKSYGSKPDFEDKSASVICC